MRKKVLVALAVLAAGYAVSRLPHQPRAGWAPTPPEKQASWPQCPPPQVCRAAKSS